MNPVEELKNHLFDITLDAIQEYMETGKEEAAYAVFSLLEITDKLGWLEEMKGKAKEVGMNV